MSHIENAKLIYKRLDSVTNGSRPSFGRANDLLSQIVDLKNELFDDDHDWVDDYEMLDFLDEDWHDSDDIDYLLKRMKEQAEGVLEHLGEDPLQVIEPKTTEAPDALRSATHITFSPNMIQNMSTSFDINVSTQISALINDFEQELGRAAPDKTKLERIKDTLIQHGPQSLGPIVDILIRHL